MADPIQNKGFTVPAPIAPSPTGGEATNPEGESLASQGLSIARTLVDKPVVPQPRDYAIAGGAMLVLMIAFFFARNGYSNYLARKRVSAGSANAAGWCLFAFLTSLAATAVLSILNPVKFLTPIFMAPLGLVSIAALVLMFVTGRRS